MLKKEVMTEYGVPIKFWKVLGFAYHLEDERGFIQLEGFATEKAEKRLGTMDIKFTDVVRFFDLAVKFELEKLVEEQEEWKKT